MLFYITYRWFVPATKWQSVRDMHSSNLNDIYYKSASLIIQGDPVKPLNKEMVVLHPHGFLPVGMGLMVVSKSFESFTCLIQNWLLYTPFIGDMFRWQGIKSISSDSMKSVMETGDNIILYPGGFEEMVLYTRDSHRIYLKQKKGFIKYAMRYGYLVRPCYVFGEEKTYWVINSFERFRMFLAKYKIPNMVATGKYLWFMPDDNIDFAIVCGESIGLPHIPNPTNEDVLKWHDIYIMNLTALFNDNKCKHGYPESTVLEIK